MAQILRSPVVGCETDQVVNNRQEREKHAFSAPEMNPNFEVTVPLGDLINQVDVSPSPPHGS